jgi:hypothetical protein
MTHDEQSALIPDPAVGRDLPTDRQRILREFVMREIRQGTATTRQSRTRRLFTAPVLTATVTAVVIVIGFGVAAAGGGDRPDGDGAFVDARSDQRGGGVALPEQSAGESEASPYGLVRNDQFVYVKTKAAWSGSMVCEAPKLQPAKEIQWWESVDGTRPGLKKDAAARADLVIEPNADYASFNVPNYRFLESLPTDPDELLKKIYAETQGDKTREQVAFVAIGDAIRNSVLPPKIGAALYRTAAKIPGVVVVKDAVDAVGRHGVAVTRVDEEAGIRDEWIFDKETMQLLGERSVVVRKTDGGEMNGQKCESADVGAVLSSTAVLDSAVVDKAGQTP